MGVAITGDWEGMEGDKDRHPYIVKVTWNWVIGSPGQWVAGFPGHWVAGSQNVTQFHLCREVASNLSAAVASVCYINFSHIQGGPKMRDHGLMVIILSNLTDF